MTRRYRTTAEDEWTHPECGPFEVLFGTMTEGEYASLPFATKRRGAAARGTSAGFPVFIHAAELAELGADQVHLLSALRDVWRTARHAL